MKEWASNENLPRGFTEWFKEIIVEFEIEEKKEFRQIADEIGVNPAILSRWLGGMGPMTQINVQSLATNITPAVYTFLGIPNPILNEELNEESIE